MSNPPSNPHEAARDPAPHALSRDRLPRALCDLLDRLARAGFEAVLVGGCVRDALLGLGVREYDVATAASCEDVLRLFPRAIPTGLRHGTVMLPTREGPIDVTSYRAGPRLEDDLAHRDFTLNAIACREGWLIDPFDGRRDLAAGRLRAVGDARARLAEDPLRALRAVRMMARFDLAPDEALRDAVTNAAPALAGLARERIRQEVERLIVAPHVTHALHWLRESGLERMLVPDAPVDAPEVVGLLEPDLALRLAGWLRGTRARAALARWRSSRRVIEEVTRLLAAHPVDRDVVPTSAASVRRLLKRVGDDSFESLVALRRAEWEAAAAKTPEAARAGLATLVSLIEAVERVRRVGIVSGREALAIDGEAVMQVLGCAPGPRIGRALRFLEEAVLERPEQNTPAQLRALLANWDDPTGLAPAPAVR